MAEYTANAVNDLASSVLLIVFSQRVRRGSAIGSLEQNQTDFPLMQLSKFFGWIGILFACVACGWMAWTLAAQPGVAELAGQQKDWLLLGVASSVAASGQLLFYSRWHWLLRVVGIPVGWLRATAASAVAELLSFAAVGAAGGDLYRGVAVGRAAEGHRVGLVTAILADRVAGVYALFCLAAIAGQLCRGPESHWSSVLAASLPVLWLAVAGGGFVISLGLFVNLGPLLAVTRRWPLVNKALTPVLASIERFRSRPWAFGVAVLWGITVHALNATVLWLIARGLSLPHPSWGQHCVIMSLGTSTGILPLPMAGLGAVELVIEQLYQAAVPGTKGAGLIAALGHRVLSMAVIAGLAVSLSLLTRHQVAPADVQTAELES